jgi:hypothetical protein
VPDPLAQRTVILVAVTRESEMTLVRQGSFVAISAGVFGQSSFTLQMKLPISEGEYECENEYHIEQLLRSRPVIPTFTSGVTEYFFLFFFYSYCSSYL